jgi:ABC-type glycerol-3-phosphate transport system permease component
MAELSKSLPGVSMGRKPSKPFSWQKFGVYTALTLGAIVAILPFIWMINWSLMTNAEVAIGKFIPSKPNWENYSTAWTQANFKQFMWNSARISAISISGLLLFTIPAAYAFAKMRFWGRNVLFGLMLATLMIPDIVTLIPNFLTVIWIDRLSQDLFGESFRWLNNWPALTIPFMATAFSIFLLRQFFSQIPDDYWDAARIDGAGHLRYLISVVLPLSKAPVATVVTFAFIGSWNSLLWPLLVARDDAWRPVAFGLSNFVQTDAGTKLHLQMAASVIMIIPSLVLYFFTQKQFTEGIATTGTKG